jgi:hypothetical protein
MAAFNYRQLIRQVPAHAWKFYLQSRKLELPTELADDKLVNAVTEIIDALPAAQGDVLYGELRRVHGMANRRGVDALRNTAAPDSAIHEDFTKFSSDAERALWVMANWPDQFTAAEAIYAVNLRVGKRGWKRLQVPPVDALFRGPEDVHALEVALANAFTPRKGTPRACQIDILDRHLDGGVQLGILVEDNVQRQLEFGDDNRAHWRDVRPPMAMDVVIYPACGVIDVLAPGGAKTQQTLLAHLGKHVFKKALQPQNVGKPMFFLNRLRDGFELLDDSECDLAAHRVERIRLSQAKVRAIHLPICDYLIKPPGEKDAPDVLACLTAQKISPILMGEGFNIIDAVISLYFEPVLPGKTNRVLHADLKQSGISNLRDMEEADARLVESLLRALGVMQSPASTKPVGEPEGAVHA